jgi:hypothetical protein
MGESIVTTADERKRLRFKNPVMDLISPNEPDLKYTLGLQGYKSSEYGEYYCAASKIRAGTRKFG